MSKEAPFTKMENNKIHKDTVGEKNELDMIDSSHVEALVKAEDGAYGDTLSDAEKKIM